MTKQTVTMGTTYLGAGGTVVGATVGNWTRVAQLYDTGTVPYAQYYAPHIQPVGSQQTSDSMPQSPSLSMIVSSMNTTNSPATDVMEGAALDEWRLLNAKFLPYAGQQFVKVYRETAASAGVSSVALVEIADLPGARIGNPGVGPKWLSGIIHYPVQMFRPFPFWWNATATDDDTTEVGAAPGTATVAVATGSVAKCGARILFKVVTGSVTKILVQNTTTGDEFTVNCAGGFAANDYIDMYHADKLGNADPLAGIVGASTFATNVAGGIRMSFWLQPGNNAISVTRITGAGTCTMTVTHQELWGSI